MKVAHFTVRATMAQSIRWKQAADGEGHAAVGTWLAEAADAYLKARARAGRPVALAWHRGLFLVALESGEVRVRGSVSPPFGTFRGDESGLGYPGSKRFTLVHVPTRRIIATMRTAAQCRSLGAELAPVLLREDRELAAGIVARHEREGL